MRQTIALLCRTPLHVPAPCAKWEEWQCSRRADKPIVILAQAQANPLEGAPLSVALFRAQSAALCAKSVKLRVLLRGGQAALSDRGTS